MLSRRAGAQTGPALCPAPTEYRNVRNQVQARDQRHQRMKLNHLITTLRTKYEFNTADQRRIESDTMRISKMLENVSPSALHASYHTLGRTEFVTECHGFCHGMPTTVYINTYSVPDEECTQKMDISSKGKRQNSARAFLRESWSKFCIQTHASLYFCPIVPFHRLASLRQSDFLNHADSGDLLLEGSPVVCESQYVQFKNNSLSSRVSVIYKDPQSLMLYILTSRTWSKRFRKGRHALEVVDPEARQLIDGIQMFPLEAYLRIKRSRGVYFMYRRLQNDQYRLSCSSREQVGRDLYSWYESHHAVSFPGHAELRLRLRETAVLKMRQALSNTGERLLSSSATYTSSQVVTEALKYASILSSGISNVDSFYSTSGDFEMRRMRMNPDQGSLAYGVLACLTGSPETNIQSRNRISHGMHLASREMGTA